jgi:hypothetical protein
MYLLFNYNRKKRSLGAHRISYALSNGNLLSGMFIDHTCRNKKCINNIHLRQVTPKINSLENSMSPAYFNSIKTHCIKGHEFNKENTRYLKNNKRQCIKCLKISNKKINSSRYLNENKREEWNKYQRERRRKISEARRIKRMRGLQKLV